ncbi:MAG: methyltransferase domain-containing protein [Spirochaetota bacterium]|nr:MAG: methyltransferase domain-containing protein [Spirochaetota bacterium]
MTKRSAVWNRIWQKKYGREDTVDIHVKDGFDILSEADWQRLVSYFMDLLDISENHDIVEIGCGGGAFLEHIKNYKTLSGVDYSENAISIIKNRLQGDFLVSEACSLPFDDRSFDLVISWSVFFYFDSLIYAGKVLEEMVRVMRTGGKIFIGDVNDEEKKELAMVLRQKNISLRKKACISHDNPDHLFYSKEFFKGFASTHNLKIVFYDEDIEELCFYENSRYRYSLIMAHEL